MLLMNAEIMIELYILNWRVELYDELFECSLYSI